MASIQKRGEKWQVRVAHRLLPKPFFYTFPTESEARAYAAQLETMLDRGIVPVELLERDHTRTDPLLDTLIRDFVAQAPIAPTDAPMLALLRTEVGALRLSHVNASWADGWVSQLKTKANLAPGTIRKRVGALARAIDWHWRRNTPTGTASMINPLRLLPRGYSQYTPSEAAALAGSGKTARRDEQRDRRLSADDLVRVRVALAGDRNPARERALQRDPAFALLFELILATGIRLSEAFALQVEHVDQVRWVLTLEGSKGHRGAAKLRLVPLVKSIRPALVQWCAGRVGRVFPFWDGTPEDKHRASARLSRRFGVLFDYAGVPDFTEHDLRHTATCNWFMLRDQTGRWMFSDVELCRIMGWTSTRMAVRYASFRAEDLSARLG